LKPGVLREDKQELLGFGSNSLEVVLSYLVKPLLGDFLLGERLDEDFFGQTGADAEAGVADLANDVGLAAEEFDFLFFAEAHFAEAMGDFRGGGKLLDAHGDASIDAAERAQERLGAVGLPVLSV
jgi:hypothetical protein